MKKSPQILVYQRSCFIPFLFAGRCVLLSLLFMFLLSVLICHKYNTQLDLKISL